MKLEATKYVQTVERGYYVLCKLYRVAPYDLSVNTYLNTSNTSSIPRQTLSDAYTHFRSLKSKNSHHGFGQKICLETSFRRESEARGF